MVMYGVDCHVGYQAGLNIESLAREGFSFMVVKATQGATGYVAPATFDDWIRRARAAGMIPGAYCWITNANPEQQADRFLARLEPVGGPEGLLLQIDNEDTSSPASADTLTRFVRRMNERTGGHPLTMYTGKWWWGPRMGSFNGAALGLRLWLSHYVSGEGYASILYQQVPESWWQPGFGGWDQVTLLQYSSSGTAGGLTANVDVNAFKGSREDLLALTTSNPAQPAQKGPPAMLMARTAADPTVYLGDGFRSRTVDTVDEMNRLLNAGVPFVPHHYDTKEQLFKEIGTPGPGQPPVPVVVSDGAAEVIADTVSGKMAELFAGLDLGSLTPATVGAALKADGEFLAAVAKAVNDDAAQRGAE